MSGDTIEQPPLDDNNDETTNDDIIEEDEVDPQTPSSERFANLTDKTLLNYGQVIPYLVDTYNLTKSGTRSYNFANIAA